MQQIVGPIHAESLFFCPLCDRTGCIFALYSVSAEVYVLFNNASLSCSLALSLPPPPPPLSIAQDQMGTASGIMGGLTALGAVVGLVSLG